MPVPGRHPAALVALLAMTAGATDAISFLALGIAARAAVRRGDSPDHDQRAG
jgi:hypothetical protein